MQCVVCELCVSATVEAGGGDGGAGWTQASYGVDRRTWWIIWAPAPSGTISVAVEQAFLRLASHQRSHLWRHLLETSNLHRSAVRRLPNHPSPRYPLLSPCTLLTMSAFELCIVGSFVLVVALVFAFYSL